MDTNAVMAPTRDAWDFDFVPGSADHQQSDGFADEALLRRAGFTKALSLANSPAVGKLQEARKRFVELTNETRPIFNVGTDQFRMSRIDPSDYQDESGKVRADVARTVVAMQGAKLFDDLVIHYYQRVLNGQTLREYRLVGEIRYDGTEYQFLLAHWAPLGENPPSLALIKNEYEL